MIWLYLMLVLTCATTLYVLWSHGSRFTFLAVIALVLALVALAGGLTIGYLIAPVALLLQTIAVVLHLRASDRKEQ